MSEIALHSRSRRHRSTPSASGSASSTMAAAGGWRAAASRAAFADDTPSTRKLASRKTPAGRAPSAHRRRRRGSAASVPCTPAPVGRAVDVGAQVVDLDRDVVLCDGSTADDALARWSPARPRRLLFRRLDTRVARHGRSFRACGTRSLRRAIPRRSR